MWCWPKILKAWNSTWELIVDQFSSTHMAVFIRIHESQASTPVWFQVSKQMLPGVFIRQQQTELQAWKKEQRWDEPRDGLPTTSSLHADGASYAYQRRPLSPTTPNITGGPSLGWSFTQGSEAEKNDMCWLRVPHSPLDRLHAFRSPLS